MLHEFKRSGMGASLCEPKYIKAGIKGTFRRPAGVTDVDAPTIPWQQFDFLVC